VSAHAKTASKVHRTEVRKEGDGAPGTKWQNQGLRQAPDGPRLAGEAGQGRRDTPRICTDT